MEDKLLNVLFLCTGNSARSIMAECILNRLGKGTFKAFSAGSQPKGEINPMTVKVLKENHYMTDDLRSKDWEEFSKSEAPELHFVFTVCDKAANEPCPIWPSQPLTAHWGFEDPAAFEGTETEQLRKFQEIFIELRTRINIFVNLPFDSLDRLSLKKRLEEMGNPKATSAKTDA